MTPAELSVMKMIRQSRTWTIWAFSCRKIRALKRLKKAGVIEWYIEGYPNWRFVIRRKKQ
jgi:hypothetical protein